MKRDKNYAVRSVKGFIAGFVATLVFHQLTLSALWAAGIASFQPFSMVPTRPFGVPAVISLSFWGGVWGILFALIEDRFPRRLYWPCAFIFGAVFPSLVAMTVVLPMKGISMQGGPNVHLLITALLINGAWGIGTGFILRLLSRKS